MKKIVTTLNAVVCAFYLNAQVTVNINPSQDNSIYSENNNSNGTGKLYAGETCSGNSRRALIQFDIAGNIPSGATITAVTLTLNVENDGSAPGNDPYDLHVLNTAWGEGTSFGTGTGGFAVFPDCNWTDATFGVTNWTTPGGDFGASVATTIITPTFGNFNWSSAGMVTNVQNWLDNPSTNNGWILIGNESATCTARRFGSKDAGTAPILSITYDCSTPPTASCQNIITSVDALGNLILDASLLNNNSLANCGGPLSFSSSISNFNCSDVVTLNGDMILTAVFDGNLPGGFPKGIEILTLKQIDDLSDYGIGSASNGGGTDGEEFAFPAISVSAGTYIYVTSDSTSFHNFFGFAADYVSSAVSINGDDAVEVFKDGAVIDVFGEQTWAGGPFPWFYSDGFAYRNGGTGPDGSTFVIGNWTMSGVNALDPALTNATAPIPVPIGSYVPAGAIAVTLTVTDDFANTATCNAAITVIDAAGPDMQCIPPTTFNLDGTGNLTLVENDIDNGSSDGCSAIILSLSQYNFTCADIGVNTITLTGTDINGNIATCTSDITIQMVGGFTITENLVIDVTCNGNADGLIDITISGGTPPYVIDWDIDGTGDNDDTEDLNLLSGGNYSVFVSDQSGCTQNLTVNVNEPTTLILTGVSTDLSCFDENDGEIDLTITGGTPPYDIDWDNDGTGDFDDNEDLINLAPNNYVVEVVDDNGCFATTNFTINNAVAIDNSVSQSGLTLTANSTGMTYQWLSSSDNCITLTQLAGETNQSYTATSNGSYAVIITNGSGCIDTSSCFTISGIGLNESEANHVLVYPNPVNGGSLNINQITPNSTVIITDYSGKIVSQSYSTGSFMSIDVANYSSGLYFIQIIGENNVETVQFQILE